MTNANIIKNYNSLMIIREIEKDYEDKTGEKLFKGRIKITYAINKNMSELKEKIKPYEDTRTELDKEYRDIEAEQKEISRLQEIENKNAKKEKRQPKDVTISTIIKEDKSREEYTERVQELLDMDIPDVNLYKIDFSELDNIPINSDELNLFMFMIK